MCLEAAIKVSEMDAGGIYLVDEDTGALNLFCHKNLSENFVKTVSHYDFFYTVYFLRFKERLINWIQIFFNGAYFFKI